jgi:hypothetical protein
VQLRTVRSRDGQIVARLLVREVCLGKFVAVASRVNFSKAFVMRRQRCWESVCHLIQLTAKVQDLAEDGRLDECDQSRTIKLAGELEHFQSSEVCVEQSTRYPIQCSVDSCIEFDMPTRNRLSVCLFV